MPDISTPNLDYNDMVEAWDINDALMGGISTTTQTVHGRFRTARTSASRPLTPLRRFITLTGIAASTGYRR